MQLHVLPPARSLAALALCALLLCAAARPGRTVPGDSPPILNPATGHYYQRIAYLPGIAWVDAYFASSQRSVQGMPGHLAVITSAAEQLFLEANLGLDNV